MNLRCQAPMRRSRCPSRLTALGAGPFEVTGLNRQHNREHSGKFSEQPSKNLLTVNINLTLYIF